MIKFFVKFLLKKIINLINFKYIQLLYFYKQTIDFRKKLKNIKIYSSREKLFEEFIDKTSEIQILEFGVFRGNSINFLAKLNSNPKTKIYGFDSFEGLSDEWNYRMFGGKKKGHFKVNDINDLEITDTRIKLIKGYFNETLKKNLYLLSNSKKTYIHFDADLYSSTLFCLTSLHGYFKSYTAFFDEFPISECSALNDYISSYNVEVKYLGKTKDNVRVACEIISKF